jgi:hypothetical protein
LLSTALPSADSLGQRQDTPLAKTVANDPEHTPPLYQDAEEMFPQDIPPEPPPDLLPRNDISVTSGSSIDSNTTPHSHRSLPFYFPDNISDHSGYNIRSLKMQPFELLSYMDMEYDDDDDTIDTSNLTESTMDKDNLIVTH